MNFSNYKRVYTKTIYQTIVLPAYMDENGNWHEQQKQIRVRIVPVSGILYEQIKNPEEQPEIQQLIPRQEIQQPARGISLEEKLDALIDYMGLKIEDTKNNSLKVTKQKTLEGEYGNPIELIDDMEIEADKWYYTIDAENPRQAKKNTYANLQDFQNEQIFLK